MDMKTHHLLFILIALPLFCSCRSSRSMLREIQALKSSLYYELTSPIYQEKADQTVYLDFIDYSNMDYYTSVKRKKSAYIPLLLYNYEGELFHLRLGESSLTQLYREFLTEALLTECNSSTCCHLIDNQKGKMIPDSAYRLEIKIRKNETCGRIKLNQSSIPWFEGEMLEVVNNKIRRQLPVLPFLSASLKRKIACLIKLTLQNISKLPKRKDSKIHRPPMPLAWMI